MIGSKYQGDLLVATTGFLPQRLLESSEAHESFLYIRESLANNLHTENNAPCLRKICRWPSGESESALGSGWRSSKLASA